MIDMFGYKLISPRLAIIGVWLLALLFGLGFFGHMLTQDVSAEDAATCYVYGSGPGAAPGYQKFDCATAAVFYPNFKAVPPNCYKAAANDIGFAEPVKVDCSEVSGGDKAQPLCYKGEFLTIEGKPVHVYKSDVCTPEYIDKLPDKKTVPGECYLIEYKEDNKTVANASATTCETAAKLVEADKDKKADGSNNPGSATQGDPGLKVDSLPDIGADKTSLDRILRMVFTAMGAIAVLVIVYAGFKYVISQGNPQETAKAKDTILYAVIGLGVAIFANVIVAFVATNL